MLKARSIQPILIVTIIGLLGVAGPVYAQDDPEIGDDADSTETDETEDTDDSQSESATGQWGGDVQAQPTNYNQSTTSSLDSSSSDSGISSGSDHEKVVGGIGIGFFGVSSLPLGATAIDTTDPDTTISQSIPAPTVGIRYWLNNFLGVEAALGIGISSSSGEFDNDELNSQSAVGFILHGGIPLALAHIGHFTFEIVPELNLGISSGSSIPDMDNENLDEDYSGFLFQLGGRAGAEVHFGFIDIPHLALQASIGVVFSIQSGSTEAGGGEVSNSSTYFGTSIGNEPWDIFTGNIAAIYYIP